MGELTIFQSPSQNAATFANLINPLVILFTNTLNSLNTLIKRNLGRHSFLALSVYDSLSRQQSRWDDVMRERAGRKENELKDMLHSLRAVCLRSFPEFLADLKSVASRPGDVGTSIADFVISVCPRGHIEWYKDYYQ